MPEESTNAPDAATAADPVPAAPPAAPPTPEPTPAQETDWKAEAERLSREARKWEDRAKTNNSAAKELETLRQQSMTDQERAVAEAKAAGAAEATSRFAGQLVEAEVRAVAAGRFDSATLSALLQGLSHSRFLLDDGTVDVKSVRTYVEALAPRASAPSEESPRSPQFPDLGQGVRGLSPVLNGNEFEQALRAKVGLPPR